MKRKHKILENLQGKEKIRILFVCLGNICRSPAAEGIMRAVAEQAGVISRFEIDSAGTYSGHKGQLPDQRMRIHARQRGYELVHRSRPVRESDFEDFDIIVAMDASNRDTLRRIAPTLEDERKIVMMTDFCRHPHGYDHVPDPYYEGSEGFELVLDMLEDACDGILHSLSADKD